MSDTYTETLLRRALADAVPDPPARPALYAGVRRRVVARRRRRTAAVAGVATAMVGVVALAWPRPTAGTDTLAVGPTATAPAAAGPVKPPHIGPLYIEPGIRFGPAVSPDGSEPFNRMGVILPCGRVDAVIHRHLLRPAAPPAGLTPICYVEGGPGSPGSALPDLTGPFSAGLLYLPPGTSLHHNLTTLTDQLGGVLVEERFNAPGSAVVPPPGAMRRDGIYLLNSDGTHHAAVLTGPPATAVTRVRTTFVDAQVQLPDGAAFVGGNITPDNALAAALSLTAPASGPAAAAAIPSATQVPSAPAPAATTASPASAAEPPAAVLARLDDLAVETAHAAQAHPSHYGGEYLDDATRQLVIQVTGGTAEAAPLQPPDARPGEVRVEVVAHTYAALERVVATITADRPVLAALGIEVDSWGPDGLRNGVVVAVVRPPAGTEAFLASRYRFAPIHLIALAQPARTLRGAG